MGIFLKTVGTTQRDGGITTATLHLTLFTYASDNVSSVTGDWTMVRLTMTLNNLSVPLRWEYFGGYGRCLESESKRLWRHTTGERKQENGMNEGRETEERKWWLSDWAWKACLHLNTATTCNQMGGLMRKESCLNMMPQCWVAPLGSSERPNGEHAYVHMCVSCVYCTRMCAMKDWRLKLKTASLANNHLGTHRSVDAQSITYTQKHGAVTRFFWVIVERERHSPFSQSFLGLKLATAKCSHAQLPHTFSVTVLKYAATVKLNTMQY